LQDVLTITLYGRPECLLCDELKSNLQALEEDFPHRLVEVDIESDAVLLKAFAEKIPVLEVGPYRLEAPISLQSLRMTLGAANDRRDQLRQIGDEGYLARLEKGRTITGGDRLSLWISKHYLSFLNLFMFVYLGLALAAPVLMKAGAPLPARVLYRIYSPLCHQFGFRSFFLFGEQFYYPSEAAGLTGPITFEQATGISGVANPTSNSRLLARAYLGDETVGFKMALCERDVSIYAALLGFGVLFGLTGRRLSSLHWLVWLLIGVAPIALDGFSQLFSQFRWPWLANVLSYRESTPALRIATGLLFGFMTAWFAYPNLESSMRETRQFLIKKFAVNRPVA
jgi:uncharacterized membrane protein